MQPVIKKAGLMALGFVVFMGVSAGGYALLPPNDDHRRIGVSVGLVVLSASGLLAGAWRGHLGERHPSSVYTPAVTIKDLMDSIIDPSADEVWNAVTTTIGVSGTDEKGAALG